MAGEHRNITPQTVWRQHCYASFKPWQAAERHLNVSMFSELLFGAAYRCIAVKRSERARTRNVQ